MRFVSTTIMKKNNKIALALILLYAGTAKAQENSPYSRYGIGNLTPSQNVVNRSMGGVSAAYLDPYLSTVNFNNPATYSRLERTIFDVGIDIESKVLRTPNATDKFRSTNMVVNYLNVAFPLKKNVWGVNIGLRPISNVSYKIESRERVPGVDSIQSLYEGEGGAYQVFAGTGARWKNLSVGINGGYFFGRKETDTRIIPVNDSVLYYKSRTAHISNFGSAFLNAGVQYGIKLSSKSLLRIGASGNLETKLRGENKITNETFNYSGDGGDVIIDSIYTKSGMKGDVIYPASYSVGIMFEKARQLQIGVDYESAKWSNYRFFGQTDKVQDDWTLRVGAQFLPSGQAKNYWGLLTYRAGFYVGSDYIKPEVNDVKKYAVTFGAGFPLRSYRSYQTTVINTNLEFGRRGNDKNSVKESFFRLSVGLALADFWFIKKKYD